MLKSTKGLILMLKSPSSTSFCMYFAFAEYRTDDSSSPAELYVSPLASTDKMKTCSSSKDCQFSGKYWNSLRHTGEKHILSSNICIFCLQIRIFVLNICTFRTNILIFLPNIRICRQNIHIFITNKLIFLPNIHICRQNIHIFIRAAKIYIFAGKI